MKTESTVKYVLRLALILLAITAVVAALLAGVNPVTAPVIAQLNAQLLRSGTLKRPSRLSRLSCPAGAKAFPLRTLPAWSPLFTGAKPAMPCRSLPQVSTAPSP